MTALIEIFKTNVEKASHAKQLIAKLHQHFPGSKINFDLSDCDKILRIESSQVKPEKVIRLVTEDGFLCKVLE